MVVLAAVLALGCDRSATGLQPGISSSCTVTLSGAVTGTYDCRPATTAWSAFDNTGGFSFAVISSGARPGIATAIVWLGEPTTRTYTNADSAAQADLSVTTSSNQSWLVTVGQGSAATGSYSLTFTSVVNNITQQTGKGYSTEGTLTATLPAVASSGATGTITLTATF